MRPDWQCRPRASWLVAGGLMVAMALFPMTLLAGKGPSPSPTSSDDDDDDTATVIAVAVGAALVASSIDCSSDAPSMCAEGGSLRNSFRSEF